MPAVTRRQYKGAAAQTTITSSLNTSATSISIAATTGWPSTASVPFFVVISPGTSAEEKCLATISGSTLTLTRAQDDTTAQSHSSGATIYPVFAADDADEANKLASTLTTRGDLLTMGSGPDFARLAVGAANTVLKSDGTDPSWGTIAAANIASDAVTTAKILDANVTTAKIADGNVTTAKILDANVTTAKIADANVTTAKIADGSVTAAKLAATAAIQPTIVDAKGDLIVATAADTVARVAVGTNGHVLTADSAETPGVKWAAVPAPGLTLISSTTIGSAVSSVTVSDVFSSTYDNYRVVVSGGAASTNLLLRLTLGSTATGYYWGQFYIVFADGTTNATNGSNTTSIPVASGTTTTLNGVVDILAPNLAEHTVFLSQGSIATEAAAGFCNGYLADTTAYTAFTLTTSTGTITGGTIKVYGYRN